MIGLDEELDDWGLPPDDEGELSRPLEGPGEQEDDDKGENGSHDGESG